MSSGQKRVLFSSRERLISPDHHRMQSFIGAYNAELLRNLIDPRVNLDLQGSAVESMGETTTAPVRAVVLNGLRVRPQSGLTTCLIGSGVVAMLDIDPTHDPDDSIFKVILDDGIALPGLLDLTPNSSGSGRIDVIECARTDLTVESDNRDIFDPSTGLFTAVSVSKVSRGALTYRIRLGTPGAGIPAHQTGWLPLAVASVPDGTVNWDTVTLWDVRPIVSDLAHGLQMQSRVVARLDGDNWVRGALTPADATHTTSILQGLLGGEFGGRRLGGQIASGVPGGSETSIDLQDPIHHAAGVSFVGAPLWFLWLATPHGLPGWRRYTAAAPRLPRAPSGIPIVSTIGPGNATGLPSALLPLPLSCGLGGSTLSALLVAAGPCQAPGANKPAAVNIHDRVTRHSLAALPAPGALTAALVPTVTLDTQATYNLVDNVTHPANARRVCVRFQASFQVTGPFEGPLAHSFLMWDAATGTIPIFREERGATYVNSAAGSNVLTPVFEVWFPLEASYPGALGLQTRKIEWVRLAPSFHASTTLLSDAAWVVAWEI